MNSTTQKFKERLLEECKKHPFLQFWRHNELLAMSVDAEVIMLDFAEEFDMEFDEADDLMIEEIAFAVEKKWLINYMNRNGNGWDDRKLKRWLREEYTSADSEKIFLSALNESQIVMLEFN